jgi:hypothetical protein
LALTLKEFWNLSNEDKEKYYNGLSEHEKLGFRMAMSIPSYSIFIPCNTCKNRHGTEFSCNAYPHGLSSDIIKNKIEDPFGECANGYSFKGI